MKRKLQALLLILSSSAFACSKGPSVPDPGSAESEAPAGAVVAAWSQIVGPGEVPTVVARFVVQGAGQSCAAFTLEPASESPALEPSERANPDPSSFPVTLCQATLPPDWTAASLATAEGKARLWLPAGGGSEVSFPGPGGIGAKHAGEVVMVTTGDTGCRGNKDQPHCMVRDGDWPFRDLMVTAAERYDPDFVVHVGDFRYYLEGDTPDTWRYWYQDFFFPAQPLLSTAPWAISRGNHEQCHNTEAAYWYGKGWFYFFEATTSTDTARCPEAPREVQVDPWYFDVSAPGAEPHRFVMLDTGPDFPADDPAKTDFQNEMSDNFTTAITWADEASSAWWVTHRPVLSLAYYSDAWHTSDDNVRAALDQALEGGTPLCDPECLPSTIVVGHIHIYQAIEFFAPGETSGTWVWPQTAIVGNGGVVDVGGLNQSPCTYSDFPGLEAEGVVSWNVDHGFTVWRRSGDTVGEPAGWSAEPYFLSGGYLTAGNTVPCGPAS